jgi:hypothetical protein
MKTIVSRTRTNRVFYALNIPMSVSFDGLSELGHKLLGADLTLGDIIVVDNKKGDKRKLMQWTKKGFMIYYARYHKDKFIPLAEHNGQLKRIERGTLF